MLGYWFAVSEFGNIVRKNRGSENRNQTSWLKKRFSKIFQSRNVRGHFSCYKLLFSEMASLISKLNGDVALQIVHLWLDLSSLTFLDTSFCCKRERPQILELFTHPYFGQR